MNIEKVKKLSNILNQCFKLREGIEEKIINDELISEFGLCKKYEHYTVSNSYKIERLDEYILKVLTEFYMDNINTESDCVINGVKFLEKYMPEYLSKKKKSQL